MLLLTSPLLCMVNHKEISNLLACGDGHQFRVCGLGFVCLCQYPIMQV